MIAKMISGGGDSVLTLAAGTSFVRLGDHDCNEVTIVNETGVAIDILRLGAVASWETAFVKCSSPSGLTLRVCQNANEIAVRRSDQTGTVTRVRYLFDKLAH